MKNVFIIILNWNGVPDTMDCLASLEKLNLKDTNLTVVVIDNASKKSIKKLEQYSTKKFEYVLIKNKKNLGFADGNNEGMKLAIEQGAEFIMLLNNDTYVDKNLVKELLTPFDKKSKVGAASPKIYFAKGFEFHKDRYKKSEQGKVIWSAGGYIDWANVFGVNRGVDEVDKGQYDKMEEVEFATGACVMFSAKALKKTGLFDWRYFMYMEDLDLSIRLKKKGFKIFYTPKAKVWHKVSQSSAIGGALNDYFISRNRLLLGFTYTGIRTRFALGREAIRMLVKGRLWQRQSVIDFLMQRYGGGSWT